ncbi:unnamed protein product [Parnassius apollo]|uniref:(apollo) hypothetical protein n=1 Tax=Parnassius apollo TaxID=110799 RepID=A0A8S3WZC7_PARAO|nr:unnamed protein product [Parnassius apollo]
MAYSQRDYAEMHYYYGYARRNAGLAAGLYRVMLIHRGGRQPDTYPDRHLFISGRLQGLIGRQSCEGEPIDPDRVDVVLEEVARDPSKSMRAIQRRTGK